MSLDATVVDPVTHGVPPGWDGFVAAQGLLPGWHSDLLAAVDWCATMPSSLVLVRDPTGTPVAAFHARHRSPMRARRFATPGRTPVVGATVCAIAPANDPGAVFAAEADQRDRAEAVRVFERAVRRRAGPVLAYRGLYVEDLPAFPTARRVTFRLFPRMVLPNEWADRAAYHRSLARKWRQDLRRVRRRIDADPTLRVEWVETLDPVEACWLAEVVRQRHVSRRSPGPPLPVRYFQRLADLSGSRFLTYREADGRLVAYLALHDDGRQLTAVCWGSRGRTEGRRPDLYFDQYLRMVDLMVDNGRERLLLGKAWEQIKSRYGAIPEARWGMVALP